MTAFTPGSSARSTVDLRARDSDRVDTCALLDSALADGQFTEDEHASRVESAMGAKTFGELRALIGDLQFPGRLGNVPVLRPERRRNGRRWALAGGTVAVAFGLGALAGVIGNGLGGSAEASDHAGSGWTTPEGIERFLDDYRDRFGDLTADEVLLFPEHASVDRVGEDPRSATDYLYRGEFREFGSPSTRSLDTVPVDLAELDVERLIGLVRGAPETLGVPTGIVDQIRFEYDDSDLEPRPIVRIYVEDEQAQTNGHMKIAFDGEILELFPRSAD